MMERLTASEIAGLDPYKFMAVIGKRAGRRCCRSGDRRVAARPAHVRKMMWLMPRMAKAVPYLGYVLVVGHKPDRSSR